MKNINMTEWLDSLRASPRKQALPILSFPSVGLLGVSVRELISDSALQAEGMRLVAENTRAAAAVSLMDLSVEAECFGATVRFSDDEVPTVVGQLIHDEDEAKELCHTVIKINTRIISFNVVPKKTIFRIVSNYRNFTDFFFRNR